MIIVLLIFFSFNIYYIFFLAKGLAVILGLSLGLSVPALITSIAVFFYTTRPVMQSAKQKRIVLFDRYWLELNKH